MSGNVFAVVATETAVPTFVSDTVGMRSPIDLRLWEETLDQVKPVCRFAGFKDYLVSLQFGRHSALRKKLYVGLHSFEKAKRCSRFP